MINKVDVLDARFPLAANAGSDAVHRNPIYSYAVTTLQDCSSLVGCGLSFTLGAGNKLVCQAIEYLSEPLQGRDIEDLMANFGEWQRQVANEEHYRWLGPHKGVVHLALASITNACWDLWAKQRGVPLWQLLLDLSSEELVRTLDLSYVDDVLPPRLAVDMLNEAWASRIERHRILTEGFPAYDTSVGWFGYANGQLAENCSRAVTSGFGAVKLKVGSDSLDRDLKRLAVVREAVGSEVLCMVDANQQWSLAQALEFAERASEFRLFWIEEPTHPDDITAHRQLVDAVAPVHIAAGEHLPNRVVFKNYLQQKCLGICQVDALRVAGVSEFLVVSMMAKRFGVPVVPHVGDMGQLHQHLVFFNHIAPDHDALFLEYIPHLRASFTVPCRILNGRYQPPTQAGASCDLLPIYETV